MLHAEKWVFQSGWIYNIEAFGAVDEPFAPCMLVPFLEI